MSFLRRKTLMLPPEPKAAPAPVLPKGLKTPVRSASSTIQLLNGGSVELPVSHIRREDAHIVPQHLSSASIQSLLAARK